MTEKPAVQRWSLLASAIKSKHSRSVQGSKRSFQSYNILRVEPLEGSEEEEWRQVSYKGASLAVRYLSPRLELTQLVGFNNTGNVCVWPSEESLAVYCLNNKHLFQVGVMLFGDEIIFGCVGGVPSARAWRWNDLSCRLSPRRL